KKYNTAYGSRKMMTSYGVEVTVPAGPYGWRMNESKEAAEILEVINSGNQVTREPVWLQRGASHGTYDYGDTYVEVNLTAQHMFFYKDGELVVEADFVSGKSSKGWDTPGGAYPLTYKQRNATLRGEDYETPVSYWMPFNGNIGLHDADWRSSFGGTLYKNNGSHGCVNLPPKAAQLIYEQISAGDPVLCYHLEGTESKMTTKASDVKVGGSPSVTKPTETKPAETKPAATKPSATKPVETTPAPTTAAPTTEAPTTTVPETQIPETSPIPETTEPETSPAIEPTEPETEAPSQPQTPQGATEASTSAQTPQGAGGPGAVTETRPVNQGPGGPGGAEPDYSAGPGATAGSTEPDNYGPGYSGGPGAA
ncbi:MAG: L,D-transpeptidase family protein, partial [Lachnospiraceae bacterium]|nr:L,D-transpeptidase family protein [Lachnospiraceae bacterium]